MFDDDQDLRGKKPKAFKDLSNMSVEELKLYKDDLNAEIARVDAEIAKKSDYFSQADKFFKI